MQIVGQCEEITGHVGRQEERSGREKAGMAGILMATDARLPKRLASVMFSLVNSHSVSIPGAF